MILKKLLAATLTSMLLIGIGSSTSFALSHNPAQHKHSHEVTAEVGENSVLPGDKIPKLPTPTTFSGKITNLLSLFVQPFPCSYCDCTYHVTQCGLTGTAGECSLHPGIICEHPEDSAPY